MELRTREDNDDSYSDTDGIINVTHDGADECTST